MRGLIDFWKLPSPTVDLLYFTSIVNIIQEQDILATQQLLNSILHILPALRVSTSLVAFSTMLLGCMYRACLIPATLSALKILNMLT